jgi:hypothetical protein
VRVINRGIALANEVGCAKIIIQSDCLHVIETLQSGSFPSTWAAAIFDDIYVQCSTFTKCEFSFYNRDANYVADRLSRQTVSHPNVRVDDLPRFIVQLLIDDVSII